MAQPSGIVQPPKATVRSNLFEAILFEVFSRPTRIKHPSVHEDIHTRREALDGTDCREVIPSVTSSLLALRARSRSGGARKNS